MVCDYYYLNKINYQRCESFTFNWKKLDQLAEGRYFTKVDLMGAYHQLKCKDEHIQKTVIRIKYWTFECRLLCFGLSNAPALFIRHVADIFKDMNDECLAIYHNGAIIYSCIIEEHR